MGVSIAQRIAALPPDEISAAVSLMSDAELEALERDWQFWARPEQQWPPGQWWLWVVLAGRGFGKTRTGAEFVLDRSEQVHARRVKRHRVALLGRTAADCRDTMVEGESGLAECADRRKIRLRYEPSKRRVTLPRLDTTMITFSAEEPESLRGQQAHTAWGDEPASWTHKVDPQGNTAWSNLQFGMRLPGVEPRAILTGTPKPIPLIKSLIADAQAEGSDVVLTQGSLRDNIANLAPQFVRVILAQYGGTLLGAQEIDGLLIDRVEGALWQPEQIERWRHTDPAKVPPLDMVVVGVDPAAEEVAETGIIVVGREANPADPLRRHVYVLDDLTVRGPAEEWARVAIGAYHQHRANKIVGEVNNGGDMVRAVIHLQDPTVPVDKVRATDGKRIRAEPVSMLYQGDQGRAHHVGYFGALEAQMTTWTDAKGEPSPDRMDALVWAVTALVPSLGQAPAASRSAADVRIGGGRPGPGARGR